MDGIHYPARLMLWEASLGNKIPDKIKDLVNIVKDAIEVKEKVLKKSEADPKQSGSSNDSAMCPGGCGKKQSSAHIDSVNGKGTFTKLKNEAKNQ